MNTTLDFDYNYLDFQDYDVGHVPDNLTVFEQYGSMFMSAMLLFIQMNFPIVN